MRKTCLLLAIAFITFAAHAQVKGISPQQSTIIKEILADYEKDALEEISKGKGKATAGPAFSAETGKEFYFRKLKTWDGLDATCSGCHTEDPRKTGKHLDTKKPIKPLAPSTNPKRFTDHKKVEKNFVEHCHDLFDRDCTAVEKGGFVAYMMSIK